MLQGNLLIIIKESLERRSHSQNPSINASDIQIFIWLEQSSNLVVGHVVMTDPHPLCTCVIGPGYFSPVCGEISIGAKSVETFIAIRHH